VAPRTAAERQLALIWAQVLGVDRVGATDNFFDLGGHSLLATRMINRVRAEFGADVHVRAVFEHPTVEALAEVVPMPTGQLTAPIPVQARIRMPDGRFAGHHVLPASSGQRRLWFLQQLDPDSGPAYIIGAPVRLSGPLDTGLLQQAVDTVAVRHETLRTAFAAVDGDAVQVIAPAITAPIERHDLRTVPDAEAELARLVQHTLGSPFDLTAAPLLRLTLARVADDEHVLTVAFHHAIGDEGSTQVFVRELAACYRSYSSGQDVDLPPLPVQYGDFAAWQADWLTGPDAVRQLGFWRERLAGLPVLDLPTDHPRPAVQSYRGARRTAELPGELADDLGRLASAHGVTLFMVGLAAFEVVLARYSGQEDFGVGTPVAGRSRPELEPLVGFFVNNVVLRADVSGDPTVAELLARVRQVALDAFGHDQVPFERLVEELRPARDLSRTPLVQVGFLLAELVSEREHRGTGLTVRPEDFDPGTSKVDLAVSLVPHPDGLQVVAEYNTDLFAAGTVDRMIAHFQMLLEEFAADAARPLSALPAMGTGELAQLESWAHGPAQELPAGCFPELFEEQVAAHPDRTAIIHDGRQVSYADLNAEANRLAHHLQEQGVSPDTLVAIVAERGITMVVAVLAILKAGGAYVPVDPTYPPDRIAFMLRDSGCQLVLTSGDLASSLPGSDVPVVAADRDRASFDGQPDTNPPRQISHRNLAYMIYTSGSTGTPKGVLITHGSLVNLHLTRVLGRFDENTRILQFAPFSFDVSAWEFTMALLGGHVLVVPRPDQMADPAAIIGLINTEHVTATFLPPSLLALLHPEQVPTIELLGSGGEDCPAEVAERWGERVRFLIGYGPTEATVYATVSHEITEGGHPPIGRPVHNTRLRVVSGSGQTVPVGVPGELYISGAGLARGYHDRPGQTAERFIVDPVTGERTYRTGDLVRYRDHGDLEFVGRLDDQVKIRGFRIELGEIEAALRAHPGVVAATVAVREPTPGDRRLAGFVVPADGTDSDQLEAALRDQLPRQLPHYMVPAAIQTISEIPLTPAGKVDRQALPEFVPGMRPGQAVVPRTQTERRLAAMFAEALGVPQVGADDDFFALGGHSLLAARLAGRAATEFKVELPLRDLLKRPTVAAIAARIDEAKAAATGTNAAGTKPAPRSATAAMARADGPDERELRRDIRLGAQVRGTGTVAWPDHPAEILFVGATGFIGGYLVERLLATTSATINCLVRADDYKAATRRLTDRFPDADRCRLRPLPGDLARPNLGLGTRQFAELAERADVIYHAAADISPLKPYSGVRGANVTGLRGLLRLACTDRPVPVHYLSSLSAFARFVPGESAPDVLREDDLPARPPTMGAGYEQSKWVAEQIVGLARRRGVPVTMYRAGRVAGDSQTGAWREDDLLAQIILACANLGMVPQAGLATEIIPVDSLAALVTRLARDPAAAGATFHCTGPGKVPFDRLAEALEQSGRPARLVTVTEWREALTAAEDSVVPGVSPVLPALLGGSMAAGLREPRVDTTNTTRLVNGSVHVPEVSTELLRRYVDELL
jgi:amino acid adenylation domain-containing protein/thioester reductase-like protein